MPPLEIESGRCVCPRILPILADSVEEEEKGSADLPRVSIVAHYFFLLYCVF